LKRATGNQKGFSPFAKNYLHASCGMCGEWHRPGIPLGGPHIDQGSSGKRRYARKFGRNTWPCPHGVQFLGTCTFQVSATSYASRHPAFCFALVCSTTCVTAAYYQTVWWATPGFVLHAVDDTALLRGHELGEWLGECWD